MQTVFDWAQADGVSETPLDRSGRAMTREQVIGRLLAENPTATREFLERFDDQQLAQYLAHLAVRDEPRGPSARPWQRQGHSPAIVGRECDD
ncbi:MAG: hypothetical protein AAGG07_02140 [Planctomycetota bacterium]